MTIATVGGVWLIKISSRRVANLFVLSPKIALRKKKIENSIVFFPREYQLCFPLLSLPWP